MLGFESHSWVIVWQSEGHDAYQFWLQPPGTQNLSGTQYGM